MKQMKTSKWICISVVILLIAGIFAGCGSQGKTEEQTEAESIYPRFTAKGTD